MQKLFLAALLAMVVLVGACRDATGSDLDVVGSYQLESINGNALPAQFFSVEVVAGTLTLSADQTYVQQTMVRAPDNLGEIVTQTRVVSGAYAREGDSLRFTGSGVEETHGTYANQTITIEAESYAIVYRRP
jgi:hypothetical protein